jgi:predicted nucleotidyltransferase
LQIFLKKLKGNMKQNLLSMVLYGSVARGKAHRESDIDLLILYRKGDFYTDEAYAVSVIESRESREYQVLFEKDILGSRKVSLPDGSWYRELKPEWKPGELIEVVL